MGDAASGMRYAVTGMRQAACGKQKLEYSIKMLEAGRRVP